MERAGVLLMNLGRRTAGGIRLGADISEIFVLMER